MEINPACVVVAPTFPYTSEILVSTIPRMQRLSTILTQSSCAQAVEEARGSSGMPGWLSAAVTSPLSRGVDHLIPWSHLYRSLWPFEPTLNLVYWVISVMELCNFRLQLSVVIHYIRINKIEHPASQIDFLFSLIVQFWKKAQSERLKLLDCIKGLYWPV